MLGHKKVFSTLALGMLAGLPVMGFAQTSCSVSPQSTETTATSGAFRITASGVASDVVRMRFPTWGSPGGQDDIVWYEGINAGGGKWYVDVNLARHKVGNPEYGSFTTHVYAIQNSGVETLCAATNWSRVQPQAPSCTSADPSVTTTYDHSGFLRIYARGVANAQSVRFPTWGRMNDQDDLVWYQGTNAGGGNWYADIDLSKHKPGSPEYGTFSTHVYVKSAAGAEALCASTQWQRPQVIAFATGNVINGWRDSEVRPNGQLAMAEDLRNSFCAPNCPSGRYRVGMEYMVDLMKDGAEARKPGVLAELNALVKSAKVNEFPFFIHVNHEWALDPGSNPIGVPTWNWAEYTDWNVPLTTYSVGWGGDTEQGLKPNFESTAVRNKVKSDIAFVSNFVVNNILNDPAAKKLFMGVDFGWETEVMPSAFGDTRIGYAALAARVNPANGQPYGPSNPPADFDAALGDVARDFVVFAANEYQARGVPKSLLFTHVVANQGQEIGRKKRTPFNANVLAGVNFGVSSFGPPFDYPRINAQRGSAPWYVKEADPMGALAAVNGGSGSPPPATITVYNWSDTMRNPFNEQNMIPAYQNLFQTP